MGRAVGHWERRGLLEGHRSRHTQQLLGSNAAILRHATVEHFTHEPLLWIDGVDEHAITWSPTAHAWSKLDNFSSHIESDNHRQWHLNARHAAHREDVVIVER